LVGCNQFSPAGPQSQPAALVAPTGRQGSVRDSSGAPVAGAEIRFWPENGRLLTNEAGLFPITGYVETIYASKPGYEPATAWDDLEVTLTLHDIIRIPVGQSARLTIGPRDSVGGIGLRSRVRTVRLIPSETTLTEIEVLADDNGPVEFWLQDNCGDVCPHRTQLTTSTLQGGKEFQLFLAVPENTTLSRTFTVKTSAVKPATVSLDPS
jgi:hypothetical protein